MPYYRVSRTYLAEVGQPAAPGDDLSHIVPAATSHAAAIAFITHERAKLVGAPAELSGDKTTATATRDGRTFTIVVERASDADLARSRRQRG